MQADPHQLSVHFLKPDNVAELQAENLRIEGGERIRGVVVTPDVTHGTDRDANVLTFKVNQPGDFSTYTLRLVKDAKDAKSVEPPDNFDRLLSAIEFSFRLERGSDFDCRSERVCPPEPKVEPEIDYLAKDYGSFRRLMLDRLAHLVPQRNEQNPADLGVALVEVLAHVGDLLSYRQDAVATEAYLGTARRRVSVRRHARLVDYRVHDGCNARVWMHLRVSKNVSVPFFAESASKLQFVTRVTGVPPRIESDKSAAYTQALAVDSKVFEPMQVEPEQNVVLFEAHNEIHFYTFGDEQCCLPKGATRAALRD